MSNVMVIPARRQVGNNIKKAEKPKLRVAAYCRVSTDSDEQATSYEAQIEHYTEFIQKNPEWVLAGIFADDGISGTNTKKRDEFNRMIEECHAGNIDMIIHSPRRARAGAAPPPFPRPPARAALSGREPRSRRSGKCAAHRALPSCFP